MAFASWTLITMARAYTTYRERIARGMERGLSRSAAAGHPRPNEPTARDLAIVDKLGADAPIHNLRQAVVAHTRATLPLDEMRGNAPARRLHLEHLIENMTDKQMLFKMYRMSRSEWSEQAERYHDEGMYVPGIHYTPNWAAW